MSPQCKVYGVRENVQIGPGAETPVHMCSGPHNTEANLEARKLTVYAR